MRTTTAGAVRLLRGGSAEWIGYAERYDEALLAVSEKKKLKRELIEADSWLRDVFPGLVSSRENSHMLKSELERVMQWKLWRGADRPTLMSLVRQNSEAQVKDVSTASFDLADKGNWKDAINKLCDLRGIGPATASAVLSILYPHAFVFMADEVIEATTGSKRAYTLKVYETIREVVCSKVASLGPEWNMERVGRVMWTAGQLSGSFAGTPSLTQGQEDSSTELTGKKRKR